jgi:nucleoside-diphosphate-sugar epimerase
MSRKTLVIGGLGFIGVNLTERLVAAGDTVTVVTPSIVRHAVRAAALSGRGVRIVEGDLGDKHDMVRVVDGQQLIFNLAGASGALRSMEDPWTDLTANCGGNLSLLEVVRTKNPAAKIVFVGSRLQYGHQDTQPVGEDAPLSPLCVHAIHKSAVEQYLKLYAHLYGIRFSSARVTNPYGPGQSGFAGYGIVNRMIQLAVANHELPIYGDGTQLRDYIFIDDLVSALIQIAESPAADSRIYNVGSGTGTRMIDMAGQIVAIAGGGRVTHVPWPPLVEKIETGDFVADVSRIRREVGWAPAVALGDGLERTVAHYRTSAGS